MNRQEMQDEKDLVLQLSQKHKKSGLSPAETQKLIQLKCRTNFLSFAIYITQGEFKPFKVHRVLAETIQKIGDGEIPRCCISLPPRTGKSTLVSRILPIWQLGRSPKSQFILASYAFHLVNEHSRFMLKIANSMLFKKIFPEVEMNPKNQSLSAIRTEEGGLIKTSSAGSDVTGFGFGNISDSELPGFGILDDIIPDGNSIAVMDSAYNWITQQFLTRGLPNHEIIMMGTRFHVEDPIGRILAKNSQKDWFNFNVPAICVDPSTDPMGRKEGESFWAEYFPVDNLLMTKREIEDAFESLYQGNPQGTGGSIFHRESLQYFNLFNRLEYYFVYMTIDTAYKSTEIADYSALCVFGVRAENTARIDVLYMDRGHYTFDELIQVTNNLSSQWRVNVIYIEGRSLGEPLIQTMRKSTHTAIQELKPVRDKQVRANSVSPIVARQQVFFYKWIPSLEVYIKEITAFPFVQSDDITDAFVYGLLVYQNELNLEGSFTTGVKKGDLPKIEYARLKKGQKRYNRFSNYI